MIGWSFSKNGYGQIRGYSDAGIETFSGHELKSLARETCQNSLDAEINENKVVRVEFERDFVDTPDIPGYQEYKNNIEKCKKYWDSQKGEKAHNFLKTAYTELNRGRTSVLRISDYNTTGLADPYGGSIEGWNSLTKVDGGSTKDGDSAGSYGVGKNAPFSNSYYRLVFYRTLNEKGEQAAQGMSRLLSFPENMLDPMATMTVGIGYYGNPIKNMPVPRIEELDRVNHRSATGTDVFIYGFKGKKWEEEITSEILESFLMSLHRKKMEVRIQNTPINYKTLKTIVNKYKTSARNAYCNYRVLSEPEKVQKYEKDFHDMGTLRLRVLIDPKEKLNRRILVVRKSGMKLFQMTNISRLISFTGILELEGVELNKYFREMETMAHDKWEPTRHSNPSEAKEYYNELKDWVRKVVMDLGEDSSDEEIEVEGLSGILQDDDSVRRDSSSEDKKEDLNNHLGQIEIRELKKISFGKGKFYPLGDKEPIDGGTEDMPGTISADGKLSAIRTLKGVRNRKSKEKHLGNLAENGEEIVQKRNASGSPCALEKIRVMKLRQSQYRLIFEMPYSIGRGYIDIVTVGENGKSSKLFVESVKGLEACSGVSVYNGTIFFESMSNDSKVKIEFVLKDTREYAMEVNVHEHN